MKVEGYDIDGVLASFDLDKLVEADSYGARYTYYWNCTPIKARDELPARAIAISARSPDFHALTVSWLKKHYPDTTFEVFLVGFDEFSHHRKVMVMESVGVTRFYDDSAEWCEFFKANGIDAVHTPYILSQE